MRGGRAVQPWRTLRANADCALFIFLLQYTLSILSSIILWVRHKGDGKNYLPPTILHITVIFYRIESCRR